MPQNGECVVCEEAITNPICLECLEEEMTDWLSWKDPSLVRGLKSRGTMFNGYPHTGVNCIICGNNMDVCAHCYSNEMYEFVKRKNIGLADEFIRLFDFELLRKAV